MNAPDDRRAYIGGPGSAAVLGVNPYMTPLALWQYITGRAEGVEQNEIMRSGQRLEPALLAYAGEMLGAPVLPGPFVRDVRLPMAAGHLDGIVQLAREYSDIVEAKTARTRNGWGEPGTDEVPPHIACQSLWYLGLVPAARVVWIPVLFSGLEFQLYRVERNEQLIEQIRNACWRWWNDYVVTDMPPPPQDGADALRLFPRDRGTVCIASNGTVENIARLREVRAQLDALAEEREQIESRIKLAMGDAATLMIGSEVAATWKSTKPAMRFDAAAFKDAEPETYKQYCHEVSSRRFLLK